MALTQLHLVDVCYGGGWYAEDNPTCKYLDSVTRPDGKYVYVCTKLNPGAYANLEKKRKPYGGSPTGDNCQGYLLLQYKKQGYDV